jgi:hypothetical protein
MTTEEDLITWEFHIDDLDVSAPDQFPLRPLALTEPVVESEPEEEESKV